MNNPGPVVKDLVTAEYTAWIAEVCAALDLPADSVDVARVHALTREVSGRLARPMAPVSAMLLGLAVGAGERTPSAADLDAVGVRIEETLPQSPTTAQRVVQPLV